MTLGTSPLETILPTALKALNLPEAADVEDGREEEPDVDDAAGVGVDNDVERPIQSSSSSTTRLQGLEWLDMVEKKCK